MNPAVRVLGIDFFAGSVEGAVDAGLRGGMVVVPSAPVLAWAASDPLLHRALAGADLALPDSGLMVLLWRLRGGRGLRRVSGLRYLIGLLGREEFRREGATFWVMPSAPAADRTFRWLRGQGVGVGPDDFYVAPIYGKGELADPVLEGRLRERRPAHVVLCVGGGVQERLAERLRSALDWRAGLHCTGAAIGFLTGDQVRIPMWADAVYLGWLFRCFSDGGRSLKKYLPSAKVAWLVARHGSRAPAGAVRPRQAP